MVDRVHLSPWSTASFDPKFACVQSRLNSNIEVNGAPIAQTSVRLSGLALARPGSFEAAPALHVIAA